MNKFGSALTCFVLVVAATSTNQAQSSPERSANAGAGRLSGYSRDGSVQQQQWEKKFQDGIQAENLRESMRRLSARPHHVGSPYDKDNAEWILSKFEEWGFDTRIESFEVLFPTPKERVVELLGPKPYRAKLQEPVVAVDPTSNQTAEQLPTYNAYSIDGDVTGPLVYVNYGNREDYEQLDRLGISVKGAIVIARYGEGWRGIKPKVAGEHGAIGCIIYSDPRDDGFYQGDDYPAGGWRPREGVQRGSVMDTDYPGDPMTPGAGAPTGTETEPVDLATIKTVKTVTRIPVLPISYADALPLLSALQGPVAPEDWRGALSITYHIGPGPAKVHLKVVSDWNLKPVFDVIATMRGSGLPDEWVIRGNHHDAWVNGADDPTAGMVAVLEEARMLGALHKQGWNPKRTIIYCAWDGEEPGLLGSTEWVETHQAELQQHAVAYINSDSNGRGFFHASGSHDLERVVNDVGREIMDPEKNISVLQRWRLRKISNASAGERPEIRNRKDVQLGSLGDGSDYTAFLDHAGIPAVNIGFGGEDDADQYHSVYDDFYWYTHFMDTNFIYGRTLAQTGGSMVMRLADADVIPYEYGDMADMIGKYVQELEKLLKDKRDQATEQNLELDEGMFTATADPQKTFVPPPRETVPPFMNFASLKNGLEAIKKSADRYQKAWAKWQEGSHDPDAQADAALNADLLRVQRTFLTERGLPERPWFKHSVYAPGAYTGYGAKPIAAVREYMDQKKWKEADAQVPGVAEKLQEVAAAIDKASADLEKGLSE